MDERRGHCGGDHREGHQGHQRQANATCPTEKNRGKNVKKASQALRENEKTGRKESKRDRERENKKKREKRSEANRSEEKNTKKRKRSEVVV